LYENYNPLSPWTDVHLCVLSLGIDSVDPFIAPYWPVSKHGKFYCPRRGLRVQTSTIEAEEYYNKFLIILFSMFSVHWTYTNDPKNASIMSLVVLLLHNELIN
jgi:hypothetical protein